MSPLIVVAIASALTLGMVQSPEDCESIVHVVQCRERVLFHPPGDKGTNVRLAIPPHAFLGVEAPVENTWFLRIQGQELTLSNVHVRAAPPEVLERLRTAGPADLNAWTEPARLALSVADEMCQDTLWVATSAAAVHTAPTVESTSVADLERGAVVFRAPGHEANPPDWIQVTHAQQIVYGDTPGALSIEAHRGWMRASDLSKSATNPISERERDEYEIAERRRRTNDAADKWERERMTEMVKKYGTATGQRIARGEIWLGMSSDMAIDAVGRPNDVNRSVGSWGVHEQWVYDAFYLYFENGKLTSWQD